MAGKRSRKGLAGSMSSAMFPDGAGGERKPLAFPGIQIGEGLFRAFRPAARPRGPRRESKAVQEEKIRLAAEKRARRLARPNGSST